MVHGVMYEIKKCEHSLLYVMMILSANDADRQ